MKYLYLLIGSAAIALTASCARQSCDNNVLDETYVHRYGVAVPPEFWEQSGEHGSVISTMADGVVITRSYCSGLLDGETTYSFPHSSQIQKKEFYTQGTMTKIVEFYFDGTPQIETNLDAPSPGMKAVATWYLSGTPRSVEQFSGDRLYIAEYYTPNNQRDAWVENYQGTRLVRDDYGQLISTDTIDDGLLASRTTYHPNGSPKELVPYENGVISGERRTYHPAGEPNTVEQWSAGNQDGVTVIYLHGEKYAEVPFVNGKRQGVESRYRDGTQLVQEITWDNDYMHGPATTYVGDITKNEWYYRGTAMSKTDYDMRMTRPPVR
jgi:antitoxin component YwqK of YwqJK toxin-antitoxin module